MAISLRGNGNGNGGLFSRLKALIKLQRMKHTAAEGGLEAEFYQELGPPMARRGGQIDMSKWKKLDSRMFGISRSMISPPSWTVLKILRGEGFEAYLVGGCVRDLILNKTPKDFDVITTAQLKQIKKQFNNAQIVGRRFPICHVRIKGSVIEVSSFDTVANRATEKDKQKNLSLRMPRGCDEKDFIRWRNSMSRDFTINSLFFDPFTNKIYDYVNGMVDLRSMKLQTLIPAQLSFVEDCARILRGLRIAARLGLSLSKDTETAIHNLSSSVQRLPKDRIAMELNYMLSYGAAEPSLCLLQRFNLLEIILPFQAAYLKEAKESVKSSNMLMRLFFHLDEVVSCDQPSSCSLWIGLLAFHLALVNNPQEALVIWTLGSILYHGNWEKGVKFAKEHARMHVNFVPEISRSSDFKSDEEIAGGVTQFASLIWDSIAAFTDKESILKSMRRYPSSSCSDFVFVSKKMGQDVAEIFQVLLNDIKSYNIGRGSFEIDYHLLGEGYLRETRFVLGKIILETMSGAAIKGGVEVVDVEKTHQQPAVREELSDILKDQLLKDRKRKHDLSASHPELNDDRVEKRKLIKKKTILSKPEVKMVSVEPSEEVDDKKCKDNGKMHLKVVKKDDRVEKRKLIKKKTILSKPEVEKVSVETPEEFDDKKCKDNGKMHLKVVKKVKSSLSQESRTQQHEVVGRCTISQEAKIKKKKVSDNKGLQFSPQQVVRKEQDEAVVENKGSQPRLSLFFK